MFGFDGKLGQQFLSNLQGQTFKILEADKRGGRVQYNVSQFVSVRQEAVLSFRVLNIC